MSRARAACHGPFGRVTLYELDRPIVTHAHRESHLILLLGGAAGVVRVRDHYVVADPLTAVAVNPWEPHAFRPIAGAIGAYLVLYMDAEWFGRQADLKGGLRFGRPGVPLDPALSRLAYDCARLLETRPAASLIQQAVLDLALGAAARSGAPPAPRRGLDWRLRRALPLLGADAAPLARIAADCGLSRAHFHRMFRDQIGISPAVFRNTLRVEQALPRVALGSQPIEAISEALGFSDRSVFSRFFAAHVGMAPSDYRRAVHVVGG